MSSYGGVLFKDRAKQIFEYGKEEKVTVLAFQSEDDIQFPSINPNIHDRAQPGGEWTVGIPFTRPTLMASTMRSLYNTLGSYGVQSKKILIQHDNIFYHSIANEIKTGMLDYNDAMAAHFADSGKIMICAHGYPEDTDHAYLDTPSGKYAISYQDLAQFIAQHVDIKREEPLTVDLSICYAARSIDHKKVHIGKNITQKDISSSFSHKFTSELARLLPNTPLKIKASATAVTYDYSSGLRLTELESYLQDKKGWTKQHRGEDFFSPETLSFIHQSIPESGLYVCVTEKDHDENQTHHTFNMNGLYDDKTCDESNQLSVYL